MSYVTRVCREHGRTTYTTRRNKHGWMERRCLKCSRANHAIYMRTKGRARRIEAMRRYRARLGDKYRAHRRSYYAENAWWINWQRRQRYAKKKG